MPVNNDQIIRNYPCKNSVLLTGTNFALEALKPLPQAMQLTFLHPVSKAILRAYKGSGLQCALSKALLNNAKRENKEHQSKECATQVYISYTNSRDAELYGELIIEKMKDIPLTIQNIALFSKAYPPPKTIKYVGFSANQATPLEVGRLMVNGIKYMQFRLE